MSDRDVLERARRAAMSVAVSDDPYEDLLRRRDRKRRRQRIAAGVVGIAVFIAALWIVTSVGPLVRSETSVPGEGVTGPAETGPVDTGPVESTPYDYDPHTDYEGLPPEGAEPSGPERSELVAEAHELDVGWVYVFEDGRTITWSATPGAPQPNGIREQRLTPEGVDLVRSGVIDPAAFICIGGRPASYACVDSPNEVPASAWEDSTLRPYVPYRYAICDAGPLGLLPAAAQDLLRGKQRTFDVVWAPRQGTECFDVTTEEARALEAILADAGFSSELPTFAPILPHGTFGSQGGG